MDETSRSQKYSFHVRVQAILRVPSQVQISPPETEITEHNSSSGTLDWASQVAQRVINLPIMRETQVQSLGQEDPLEKGMATHSSILAWRIPWTEEPGSDTPWGHKELDLTE